MTGRASVLAACLLALSASAGEPSALDRAKEAAAFAETLFQEGDYYRAITEFKRAAFLAPGTELELHARFGIGRAYQAGQKWEQAEAAFKALGTSANAGLAEAARFQLAETLRLSGDDGEAETAYRAFLEAYPGSVDADRARRGLAACLARLGRLKEASEALKPVQGAAGARRALEAPPDLRSKSPALAGTMSAVLPGSGQWYAGNPAGGASYFLLNAALIGGASESFRSDRNVLGAVLALGAAVAYAGNVYGAIGDAHKANRDAEERYLRGIEEDLRMDRLPSEAPGFALVWSVRF